MKRLGVVASALLALIAVLGLSIDPAQAQLVQSQRKVYSAKFVCGSFQPPPPGPVPQREGPVKPGNYQTAINVVNPTRHPLVFLKKAVLLYNSQQPPPPTVFEQPMPPGPYVTAILEPNWGFEIDCPDIRQVLLGMPPPLPGTSAPFIKGFVVLETFKSNDFLDVVGAYTSHGYAVDNVCAALGGAPCDPTNPLDPCFSAGGICAPAFTPEGFSTDIEKITFTISNN
jgi:hypothetical protein